MTQVLTHYIYNIEETFTLGSISPWSLSPEDLLLWPLQLQTAYLNFLRASLLVALPCAEAAGAGRSWSAAFLRPLLQLLASSGNAGVVALCQDVLVQLLARLQLHQGSDAEVRHRSVAA